ncbi:hypothetical protein AAG570_012338 [Ranatra chinensis]|uniref:Tetratricopeptide repeat protein 27 n=1 Tax=Ranatra chinensis TaxID=642074 RepID=A0ABD0YII2_9HEMI
MQEKLRDNVVAFFNSSLSIDGEGISLSVLFPELLLLAEAIFDLKLQDIITIDWWLMRCLYIHQQILDEHSPTLQTRLFELSQTLENLPWVSNDIDLRVLLHLEVARIHLHYGKVTISGKEICSMLKLLNIELNLVGVMGKRTHYQQKDVAQLAIKVKLDESAVRKKEELAPIDALKDVMLEDEVRLPHIAFTNPSDVENPDLSSLEQAALIAVFVHKKKSQAKDRLQKEEIMPYLRCLLSYPKVWSFQLAGLLFRSRLECDHRRTIERSLLQTQALMECDNNTTPVPLRLHLFYCSYVPPQYIIAAECASILYSVGSIQSALDLYLKLQMWEEVINCYNQMKLRHKAAEVIREQMKKGETVKLLCYLGDATDDVAMYEKAWELSEHRSAQAQRHWGMFYFNRKNYAESIDHLKESLKINSLQVSMWFRLGYAALMEQKWEDSATAYRRYCALEPDSFEAWNNLAKAYILLGQKQRAYNALQEAVKCNYEKWQVWDNLMAVSSDCGDFEEVIHCYHRILDLKEKHIDEQILTILSGVIIKGTKDWKGQPASRLKKKALELFGRITAKVLNNLVVWKLYAHLTASVEEQTSITRTKTVQYMQKAYSIAVQEERWYRDLQSTHNVLQLCQSLGETYLTCCRHCSNTKEVIQLLTSAKLYLKAVISVIEREHLDSSTGCVSKEIENEFVPLQKTYCDIDSELSQLKNS